VTPDVDDAFAELVELPVLVRAVIIEGIAIAIVVAANIQYRRRRAKQAGRQLNASPARLCVAVCRISADRRNQMNRRAGQVGMSQHTPGQGP
jgi:hypothetical protein